MTPASVTDLPPVFNGIEAVCFDAFGTLVEITDRQQAFRPALEELVDLRSRIGLELVEYRGRVIFVVPDGGQLVSWRAPGLSEMASYNGRMYRLSDQN